MVETLAIIGSGPAGYTAALYAARAQLSPLVLEGFQLGGVPGGQLMTTTAIENFPGFPDGIHGPDLMQRLRAQAQRWGARFVAEDVVGVNFNQYPFRLETDEEAIAARTVIIATGATAKRLHLPDEELFWNDGISACAICDGASPLFRGAEVAVVGGGDVAAEEALYLTKYASRVHLLVRRGEMRASQAMQERVFVHPQIAVRWHTIAVRPGGNGALEFLEIRNTQTERTEKLTVSGLFYAIGHRPNTEIVRGQLELDDLGYIQTSGRSMAASVPGVWAAGDVQDREYRQAITAAGSGCMAALEAERWLAQQQPMAASIAIAS